MRRRRLKRVAILVRGGEAREIAWLVRDINRDHATYEFLGYIARHVLQPGGYDTKEMLLGDEVRLLEHRHQVDCLVMGIGDPTTRCKLAEATKEKFPDMEWPILIHPSAIYDSKSCQFHAGSLLCAWTTCTVNITFGPFALLNFGCTIGHEVQVGRGCVVSPGANISGGVILEDGVLVGTGAQVLQYVRVGEGAKIGAGAVVVDHVEANSTVIGIPAKPSKRS